jgi:hypothetical protein
MQFQFLAIKKQKILQQCVGKLDFYEELRYNYIMDYKTKRQELLIQKMKLDKFFTMYLDKFDRQMDLERTDTPIWKLYKQKSTDYNKVCQEIRNTEYWIKKHV